jgi:hypothetical protein
MNKAARFSFLFFVDCPTLSFPPELLVGLAGGLISYSLRKMKNEK